MKKIVAALFVVALAPAALAAGPIDTFKTKCAACHGANGKGTSPMAQKLGVKDLTVTKLSVAEMQKVITDGKGKMTGFKGKISDAEIKEVAEWIKGGMKVK